MESVAYAPYPTLEGDIETDVVIIGAGAAGLSTAYQLKQAGLKVVVLEKDTIGSGTTGFTTGKVTSQHGLVYASLQERFGSEKARLYGEANETALEEIRTIITKENIDCDWRDEDNYVYTEKKEQVATLKKEAEVAESFGLPASFETETPLPFAVKGAVRFSHQGTFHSRKYVLGLARAVDGDGSSVFEHTRAGDIDDGEQVFVKTEKGSVRAKAMVIATLVPYRLSVHTAYSAIEYPLRSYIVATKADIDLPGMYITPDNPPFSILPVISNGEKLLLIGGQSNIPGLGKEEERYKRLLQYAKKRFGAAPTPYQWSAWDYLAYDHVPAIGKLYPWSKNIYTATGFKKWGMTTSMVAGLILRDLITKKENPWLEVFDSTRGSSVAAIPKFLVKELPKLLFSS